jgi:hypothetical protein
MGKNDQRCKIYSISSQDAKWSCLRDFSDKMWRADTGGFWFDRSMGGAGDLEGDRPGRVSDLEGHARAASHPANTPSDQGSIRVSTCAI